MNYRQRPRSLVNPESGTPATRRAVIGAVVDMSAPGPTEDGFATMGHRFLHVLGKALDVASAESCDLRLWVRDGHDQEWVVWRGIGSSPNYTVALCTEGSALTNPGRPVPIEIDGIEKVYPQLVNMANVPVLAPEGFDLWLLGSTF